jgi:protocatechuate 3,4-dioxygenase beta subunit
MGARAVVVGVCAAVTAAGTLSAQAVRGVLVERGSGRAIRGAFVVLLDERDAEVARALTDDAGRFLVRAPTPGRYRLQSKRIGFRLSVSPPLTLGADQTVGHRMEVEAVPAVLPPVVVEGRPQCGSRGEVGSVTARLWEEAREALAGVTWTAGQRLHRYQLLHFERDYARAGDRRPQRDSTWTTSGYAESPFQSLPAVELADRGYIVPGRSDTVDYYAPDATVLLSDVFLNTHCFTARGGAGEELGLIGLAFEPAPGRHRPDVRGVLWLDRRTAELRRLTFTYTNLTEHLPEGPLGGAVEFMRLSTGGWIVQHWWIRMARMARVVYTPSAGLPSTTRQPEPRLVGFRERGGQVMTIATARGTVVYSARQAILEGTVFDSTRGVSLGGAVVILRGTSDSARADGSGAYSLAVALDGTYDVSFRHRRLDSLGVAAPWVTATLAVGRRTVIPLAIPSEARLLEAICPSDSLKEGERVLVGVVRAQDSGRPIADARVEIRWQVIGGTPGVLLARESFLRTVTDSAGRYVLCGAPLGLITLRVSAEGAATGEAVYRFVEEGVWIDDRRYRSFPGRIWTTDFSLKR